MTNRRVVVLGLAGFSGSGKTTLAEKLIPQLLNRGVRCAIIKSTHHRIEIDKPGKDSYRLRHAGAKQVLLVSPECRMSVADTPNQVPRLEDQLDWIDKSDIDLILVEGFKDAEIDKLEIHCQSIQKPYLYPTDPHVVALVCDTFKTVDCSLPQFQRDDIASITTFIIDEILGKVRR